MKDESLKGLSRIDAALKILDENAIMVDSLLTKEEHRKFNGDFCSYLCKKLKAKNHNYDNCHNITCKRKSENVGWNLALETFSESLKDLLRKEYREADLDKQYTAMQIIDLCDDIASSMKK